MFLTITIIKMYSQLVSGNCSFYLKIKMSNKTMVIVGQALVEDILVSFTCSKLDLLEIHVLTVTDFTHK